MRLPNVLWSYIVLFIILLLAVLIPALSKARLLAQRLVCGVNMEGLACAITVYSNDYDGLLPTQNWCDLLIEEADVSPKSFVCPGSDAIEGECCYAMNKNIAGMKLKEVPANMVLFFETDLGIEVGPRRDSIKVRKHYEFLKEYREGVDAYRENRKVHGKQFNQFGGPENLVLRHDLDGQPGCNIVFANGHPEFVTEDRIVELQWRIEE